MTGTTRAIRGENRIRTNPYEAHNSEGTKIHLESSKTVPWFRCNVNISGGTVEQEATRKPATSFRSLTLTKSDAVETRKTPLMKPKILEF